jgi:hypothetical protein
MEMGKDNEEPPMSTKKPGGVQGRVKYDTSCQESRGILALLRRLCVFAEE